MPGRGRKRKIRGFFAVPPLSQETLTHARGAWPVGFDVLPIFKASRKSSEKKCPYPVCFYTPYF
jgi:hypothetical protein